jgi:uncharacterized membrane protein
MILVFSLLFSFLLTAAIIVVLARVMYLDFDGQYCPAETRYDGNGAAPGECYYYKNFLRYKVGILLHLAGIFPASVLAVIQFTPFIRQRWIMVHRICGYLAVVLYAISLVGVLMIARRALGGSIDVQAWCGFVGIGVLVCFVLSVYNIRKLQIEQHRAWMLRGWFYVCENLSEPRVTIDSTYVSTGWLHNHFTTHHGHLGGDHHRSGVLCRLDLREDCFYLPR